MPNALIKVDLTPAKAMILSAMPASADRDRVLRGLGAAAVATWKKLAQQELRSTSRDYIAGISAPILSANEKKVEIVLEGRVPNMVEQGWKGGDLRQWLLSGPNVKQGKNGPYNIVPFRHGTPGTGGRNVGNVMPGPIYDVAKKLAPTISRPGAAISGTGGRTTIWGARLHPGLPMKAEAAAILGRTEKPWHSTSIYMGMVRKAQPTRAGRYQTSGFQTFRTISMHTNDPGRHWIHPGIKARHLAAKVEQHMVKLAHQIIGAATGTGGAR
jgi:hypothetical protein